MLNCWWKWSTVHKKDYTQYMLKTQFIPTTIGCLLIPKNFCCKPSIIIHDHGSRANKQSLYHNSITDTVISTSFEEGFVYSHASHVCSSLGLLYSFYQLYITCLQIATSNSCRFLMYIHVEQDMHFTFKSVFGYPVNLNWILISNQNNYL